MKIIITILLMLCALTGIAQLQSFIVRGDTLYSRNPSTGAEIQLNKLGISAGTQMALDSKAGYGSGFGGAVTQLTSKSTAVTINKLCGQITMSAAALGAGAEAKFTINNTLCGATDVPVVAISSGGTSGSYMVAVTAVSTGVFDITISNVSATSLSQSIVLNFLIIKASAN